MAYVRKTKDEYNIVSSYDHGKTWDVECTESTHKEAKEQRYLYATNCTCGMYRIQKRRVKI